MAGLPAEWFLMDVKTVCLGMLTDGPASGYDMKKCFESSFGHFFPAGYGSIYPALATLARNGMVEWNGLQPMLQLTRTIGSFQPISTSTSILSISVWSTVCGCGTRTSFAPPILKSLGSRRRLRETGWTRHLVPASSV